MFGPRSSSRGGGGFGDLRPGSSSFTSLWCQVLNVGLPVPLSETGNPSPFFWRKEGGTDDMKEREKTSSKLCFRDRMLGRKLTCRRRVHPTVKCGRRDRTRSWAETDGVFFRRRPGEVCSEETGTNTVSSQDGSVNNGGQVVETVVLGNRTRGVDQGYLSSFFGGQWGYWLIWLLSFWSWLSTPLNLIHVRVAKWSWWDTSINQVPNFQRFRNQWFLFTMTRRLVLTQIRTFHRLSSKTITSGLVTGGSVYSNVFSDPTTE